MKYAYFIILFLSIYLFAWVFSLIEGCGNIQEHIEPVAIGIFAIEIANIKYGKKKQ